MRWITCCLALVAFALPVWAQHERYELGQRLKAFEAAWEEQPDKELRKKALAILPKVTQQFFSFQLGEAGRTLDEARWALRKDAPTDAEKWLTALYANPERRLVDSKTKTIEVVVKQFYPVKGAVPAGVSATLRIGDGPKAKVDLNKLPATVTVAFPEGGWQGDWLLKLEMVNDGGKMPTRKVAVSAMRDLEGWLDKMNANVTLLNHDEEAKIRDGYVQPNTIVAATMINIIEQLNDLAKGDVLETDMPFMKFPIYYSRRLKLPGNEFADIMSLARVFDGHTFNFIQGGDFRLSLPLSKKKAQPLRIYVPTGLKTNQRVPIVFALHGAGGTENLFFEGYGNGHIVKECQKRGWLLVAPRSGLNFTGGPPIVEILKQLSPRYPIDMKRVYIVGHSMGASQTVALCQAHPDTFAAAAALGGGGRVSDVKNFGTLPVFVGIGTKDFAYSGAKSLAKSLKDGGANVSLKEYEDLEHLVIVREALPDVFKMFDEAKR